MCGIAGYATLDLAADDEPRLRQMANALRHRGPDDEGFFIQPGIGLASRRLSIIDLAGSDQPIANEDGTIQLVFNGEIYNYLELRADLERRGHRLATHGDAETLVHLYEEHGPGLLQFVRGMFAFALWDSRRKLLLLARDRLGKKPLTYFLGERRLFFSSELAPLLDQNLDAWEIDPNALASYLLSGFVTGPSTIVRQLKKLPPAHYLVWQEGRIDIHRYWSLAYTPKTRLGYAEALEQVRSKIDESLRLRLRSDVPLGLLLSGGIDSNALLARLVRGLDQKVQTFTIGFRETGYDESGIARASAQHFGVEHHELTGSTDLLQLLPEVVRHYGEPFADKSALPTMLVCALTREKVKVALSGDGGDEAFAGYSKYLMNSWQQRSSTLFPIDFKETWTLNSMIGRGMLGGKPSRNARRAWLPETNSLFSSEFFSGRHFQNIATPLLQSEASGFLVDLVHEFWRRRMEPIDRMLDWDNTRVLPDDMLVKLDIASMARSLEVRSPFLDQELVELCASFPSSWKVNNGQGKRMLREIVQRDLPPEVLRAPKHGFSVPLTDWFRNGARRQIHDGLIPIHSALQPFIEEKTAHELLADHQSGRANHALRLWALWVLNEWARTFLKL